MEKRVFLGNPGRRRKRGRPKLRWLDWFEDNLKTLGVRRWTEKAEDREEWAIILNEAMVNYKNRTPTKKTESRVTARRTELLPIVCRGKAACGVLPSPSDVEVKNA
jgi:hypothetical protein